MVEENGLDVECGNGREEGLSGFRATEVDETGAESLEILFKGLEGVEEPPSRASACLELAFFFWCIDVYWNLFV